MITFENISIAFGDFVAVPDFSLTINEGEFFTLLGPSGCGKTTVLRALAGLNEPKSGRIYIDGKDVTKLPSDRRQVGMVFQNYALFPSMTVAENIAYGLKVAKVSKDERIDRVWSVAAEVGLLDSQMDRQIGELSGGQQQRVAIARALVMRPKILLLDEPLSNLDAKLRIQLRTQLKEMQEHFGVTSLYVTHDQEEALTMSDRLVVMDKGEIEQCGTPRQIYSHSETEFVCNFIGEANFIPAEMFEKTGLISVVPEESYYVRVEQMRLNLPGDNHPSDEMSFPGKIVATTYQGTTSAISVDIGEGRKVKALVLENGSDRFEMGDEVQVSFPLNALLTYPGGRS